ncbi:MAG: FAD:protein FMN transferase [Methylotenera sp.]|nr:FAD:protein FMN transferase [Methylotenera sp.]
MATLKRMRPLLGTFVEIGCGQSDNNAEQAVSLAFGVIEKIHYLLSFHEATSDLTKLNQAKGEALEVDAHTLRAMRLARGMTIASAGLFNCTLGGTMVRNHVLPNHGGASASSGSANDIRISGNKIKLLNSVKITLDGIAKGYAVDCAISTMKRCGLAAGWVNAGGDLRVYGDCVLPVQRRELNGEYVALGGMKNAAIATSTVTTDYDDKFPGKIMSDLTTPYLGSWSVMAHMAWRADALTKVACLAEASQREALIASLGGMIVTPQGVFH